jgi:signal transduction histidine kinase
MRLPAVTGSLRFRLSGMTSAVMFGGALLMISVFYAVLLTYARNITREARFVSDAGVLPTGQVFIQVGTRDERTLESFFIESVLNEVTLRVVISLVVMFVLSLLVGWLVAGRALRPIDRITAVARDIEATDLSRRIGYRGPEDELTRMADTFDSMLDRLDEAFRGQKETLARTSHDLRTPLAVIRSNLEVAMGDDETSPDDWRETAAVALRATERMSSMVEDLLAAARLEVSAPSFVSIDLADLVRHAGEDLEVTAEGRGIALRTVPSSVHVSGDRSALGRALGNLVDNALRAGTGEITVACGAIEGWAYLGVADRGPGVDPALVRGESEGTTGLGLRIVREVARLHGGHVDATARVGGGSVVAIWVPVAGSPPGAPPPMSALSAV